MDFEYLDILLKSRKISRRKLALETGIKPGTMSTAFMRRSGLSVDDVIRIADYLGVDYYFLEGWDLVYDDNFVRHYAKKGVMIDVPFENKNDPSAIKKINESINEQRRILFKTEVDDIVQVIQAFECINDVGRNKIMEYIRDIMDTPKYRKDGEG